MPDDPWTLPALLTLLDLFQDTPLDLLWTVEDGVPAFAVHCPDVFWWGASDAEPLHPADLPDLMATRDACRAPDGTVSAWWPQAWAARHRGLRPQGALLRQLRDQRDPALTVFLAAGPPRLVDLGNPVAFDDA